MLPEVIAADQEESYIVQRIDPMVSETGIISAESILLMNSIFQVLIILKRVYMRYFLLLQRTKAERMRYNIQDLK